MHRDAICSLVECGQKANNLILATRAKNMQAPCAIFATTPGKKYSLHQQIRFRREMFGYLVSRLLSARGGRERPNLQQAAVQAEETTLETGGLTSSNLRPI
jgi:hypothetical protein